MYSVYRHIIQNTLFELFHGRPNGRIQRGDKNHKVSPEKSQKIRVSLQYWSDSLSNHKATNVPSQNSMLGHHLNGVLLAGR